MQLINYTTKFGFNWYFYLSDMVNGKNLYISTSASVNLIPLVSSSSNEPMSNASAAFTSPRGGINGGVYFCIYTWCQSMPLKKLCSLISSALSYRNYNKERFNVYFTKMLRLNYPRPLQPNRLSTSRISRPSRRFFKSLLNESGSSTFCNSVFLINFITLILWHNHNCLIEFRK